MLSKKAGCSNWQPEIETKSPESLEEKKNTLNALHNAFLNNVTLDLETTTLLNETYNMQRLFLNKCDAPTIEEIVTEWPVLLTTPVTFWHFEKLTSKNINVLEEQFTHKAPKILQLGQQNKIKVTCENSYLQCLEVIAKYFNEDLKILVDEQDKRNQTVTCNEPCIRTNQEDDENRYFIYIEKKKVAERLIPKRCVAFPCTTLRNRGRELEIDRDTSRTIFPAESSINISIPLKTSQAIPRITHSDALAQLKTVRS
ncbi:hypothetical protein Zmor_024876 [Zophobas morio]|uniref:Uncharacterized protein n=1 Tax=Zophobas morio TaxID=2755281 RepID=A0AA38HQW0_9CUCU|nr:hypothetical protein Zmor_024876 [Zophobas morio]